MSEKMMGNPENFDQQSYSEQKIQKLIDSFKAEGYDTIGYNGEYVYGCYEKDIPESPVDRYAPIDSEDARNCIKQSIEDGYRYEEGSHEKKEE